MNFLYGTFTALLVVLVLKLVQPTDPVMTGFLMFFLGTLHGSALLLYMLKNKIKQEINNQ